MTQFTEYQKAYESAKQELADLIAKQQEAERRIVLVRQSLQTLAGLCQSEGVDFKPSAEASYLLENSTLADEIRTILKAASPQFMRPRHIKFALERLGHDLAQYQNPQATIHMVLKRMAESGEVQEETIPRDGKKTYRFTGPHAAASIPVEQGEKDEKSMDSNSARVLRSFVSDRRGRGRGRRGSRRGHGRRG
ncbi:MAG TPA: hypothetical protein VGT24_05695 [Candidatus Acidoferrales bacterium]|nr:hypothetical protein [Candidatus Acidoferrales bacterium]